MSFGTSERDACLVAVTRIRHFFPGLLGGGMRARHFSPLPLGEGLGVRVNPSG
jgi:hypothetical protein